MKQLDTLAILLLPVKLLPVKVLLGKIFNTSQVELSASGFLLTQHVCYTSHWTPVIRKEDNSMQEWQERIEADQRETNRRLTDVERKQQTEQIRVIVERQVEESPLLQQIYTDVGHMKADIGVLKQDVSTLKTDVSTLKGDVTTIKTIQNGHSKFFEEHGKRLAHIEAAQIEQGELLREQGDMLKKILEKLQ